MLASLLLPPTPSRTLRFVHEARGARPDMLSEVLRRLVQFSVATSAEVRDPEVLPRMTVSGSSIFIHNPTVRAECYLFLLAFAIVNRDVRQAIGLMKLVDHVLSL